MSCSRSNKVFSTTSKLPKIVAHGQDLDIQTLDQTEGTETVRNPFWQFNNPGGWNFQELGASIGASV